MALNWIEHVEKLNQLHILVRAHEMGYDISCEEGSGVDRWSVTISAIALGTPVFFTETYPDLDPVLTEALEYLKGLAAGAH